MSVDEISQDLCYLSYNPSIQKNREVFQHMNVGMDSKSTGFPSPVSIYISSLLGEVWSASNSKLASFTNSFQ